MNTVSELEELLETGLSPFTRSENLWRQYHIEQIDDSHIIESPNEKLKKSQRNLLSLLNELDFPVYLYSVRGRSFVDGTASHIGTANHIIKMDIHRFFLSTGREKVYRFWKDDMAVSKSVAAILTNLTTVDLRQCSLTNVVEALKQNNLCISHLGFGLPTSVVLSFLCNIDMFNELEKFALTEEMVLSVFVDDIILSSHRNVTRQDYDSVRKIIMNHGYKINRKSKYQNGDEPIVVTGLYLSNRGISVPNKKQKEYKELKQIFATDSETADVEVRYQGLKSYIASIRKTNQQLQSGKTI